MDNDGAQIMTQAEKLASVREKLQEQGLAAFLVPRSDEHLGEYVPPSAERLAWLTGFTGSAGLAAVLPARAAVWSDGRYVLQLDRETDGSLWERLHLTEQPPPAWLAESAGEGAKIGYDPWLMSEDAVAQFTAAGLSMVPVATNLADAAWKDRPAPPSGQVSIHALALAGVPSDEKRERIGRELSKAKQDVAVLTDPASIAWLLNIRGQDVDFTPFALGFALLHADGGVELFMSPEKISADTRAQLGNASRHIAARSTARRTR